MSCSESNPVLWAQFLKVFKNINGFDFRGTVPVTEEECKDYIEDIRETCR